MKLLGCLFHSDRIAVCGGCSGDKAQILSVEGTGVIETYTDRLLQFVVVQEKEE